MIRIYGSSDDLVEIEGDVNEEFNIPENSSWIALSNGMLIKVVYDGEWYFPVLYNADSDYTRYDIGTEQASAFAQNDYSEVVEVKEHIKWIVLGDRR